MTINWLYDVTIVLYALSVCGYFIDFLENNRRVNRIAFWLLSIVWLLQTVIFFAKAYHVGEFPILTTKDGLFFLSWLIVTLSLLINRLLRVDFFVFFANLIGFTIMAINLFKSKDRISGVLAQHLMSDLLVIHITIAFISYAAFTISFILSLMYLVEYNMLKKKKWGKRLVRFGSLSKIDQLSFFCNLVGVPLLLTSLVLGIMRAYSIYPDFNWFDPKVIVSFIVFGIYCLYLYLRLGKNVYGKPLTFWNTLGFLLVLINVFLSEALTNFHLW
ncbi:HemX protein [Scopulibacillus darangshiensis]|uniref:HemX protein n=1 Tax=Scopulibacillus darangshiensis TaxID=442528 RepID=A0A4R2PDN7_9BACL|nr:cytochrome c biogenesis protein CcsA [Scopulibacillus darangshiensis]TCP32221.1 HemX protein [Scopulibacillus darangshiensis]